MSNSRTEQLRATLCCAVLFWCCRDLPSYAQFTTTLNVPPEANIGDGESIGAGTRLILSDGGQVGDGFAALSGSQVDILGGVVGNEFQANGGSVVNISGGTIGRFFNANSGSKVTVSGGEVGIFFRIHRGSIVEIAGGSIRSFNTNVGSQVNITGGMIGPGSIATHDSVVNISGGEVGSGFGAFGGTIVNISGGSLGERFQANSDTVVNISGGQIGNPFRGSAGPREVNFFVTEVEVNGADITSIFAPNIPRILDFRDVRLTGRFVDGSPFGFDLNSTNLTNKDFFAPGVSLSVTLVDTIPGDFNGDGTVGTADYTVWRDGLDSVFTPGHYHVWKANFGEVATVSTASVQVPEPLANWLIGAATMILSVRRAARRKQVAPRTKGLSFSQSK